MITICRCRHNFEDHSPETVIRLNPYSSIENIPHEVKTVMRGVQMNDKSVISKMQCWYKCDKCPCQNFKRYRIIRDSYIRLLILLMNILEVAIYKAR